MKNENIKEYQCYEKSEFRMENLCPIMYISKMGVISENGVEYLLEVFLRRKQCRYTFLDRRKNVNFVRYGLTFLK